VRTAEGRLALTSPSTLAKSLIPSERPSVFPRVTQAQAQAQAQAQTQTQAQAQAQSAGAKRKAPVSDQNDHPRLKYGHGMTPIEVGFGPESPTPSPISAIAPARNWKPPSFSG
jgi:hypothetical protein